MGLHRGIPGYVDRAFSVFTSNHHTRNSHAFVDICLELPSDTVPADEHLADVAVPSQRSDGNLRKPPGMPPIHRSNQARDCYFRCTPSCCVFHRSHLKSRLSVHRGTFPPKGLPLARGPTDLGGMHTSQPSRHRVPGRAGPALVQVPVLDGMAVIAEYAGLSDTSPGSKDRPNSRVLSRFA